MRCLTGACFEEVGVDRVIACIDCENDASAHVARRLGMERLPDGDFLATIKGEERLQHTYSLERGAQ